MRNSWSLLFLRRVCIPLDNGPCCLQHQRFTGEHLQLSCLLAAGVDAKLPSVPTGKVAAPAKSPEELELEQLQAEMAL
jgi:hypothetical protein